MKRAIVAVTSEQLEALRKELDDLQNRRDVKEDGVDDYYRRNKRIRELERIINVEERRSVKVGDGVTVCLYSDRHAYTVIRRTPTRIFIQRDTATLRVGFKPEMVSGGFVGHTLNNDEQTYTYAPNPDAPVDMAVWSEKFGCFRYNDCPIITGRSEKYDYNF